MYPGMMQWWRSRHEGHDCGGEASCGPGDHGGWQGGWRGGWGHGGHGPGHFAGHHEGGGDGGFGVRRPLRFLAYKLELGEAQVAELAKILNELKTERAQAAVDDRRTVSAFADAVAGEAFDAARAGEGGELRVKSAERLRDAVAKALAKIHALLDARQRSELAYLIRTGTLSI
jgi:Spy/CpxP family protein refolding chaperone